MSIKRLSEILNLSKGTISMALRDDDRVAEKTRDRVKALAEEMKYVPSHFGRALQANKSKLIGYLAHSITVSYFNEVLQGAGGAAAHMGYGLMVGFSDGSEASEAEQILRFREKGVDAIVFMGGGATQVLHDTQKILPVVTVSGEERIPGIPSVINDEVATGEIAVAHLLKQGHTRLVYGFSVDKIRCAAALAYVASDPVVEILSCRDEAALEKKLLLPQPPTAVICYSDAHAVRVYKVAAKLGLSIPEDLAVIGVDDSNIAGLPAYDLTSIAPQKTKLGATAIEMVGALIEGQVVESVALSPQLVVRKSTQIIIPGEQHA